MLESLLMSAWLIPIFIVLSLWEMIWKGFGMWHSARGKQLPWFIVILIFNTVGILPIVYLIWFRKNPKK